jgi:hypothetical protein
MVRRLVNRIISNRQKVGKRGGPTGHTFLQGIQGRKIHGFATLARCTWGVLDP